MSNLFLFSDSGPTGHGEVARQFVNHLIDEKGINLNWSTHDWGLTPEAKTIYGAPPFPDEALRKKLFDKKRINSDCLVDSPERFQNILIKELKNRPASMTGSEPHNFLIKDFSGKENIWLGLGEHGIPRRAPQDKDIYTIWETDYSLSRVTYDVHRVMEFVDEVWIPNDWNYEAFENSGADMSKVKVMPYGVEVGDYLPSQSSFPAFRDDKFNFLFVGRWASIKGVTDLLEAFFKEFKRSDNVRLLIKTMALPQLGFPKDGILKQAREMQKQFASQAPPEAVVLLGNYSRQSMADLYGVSHALVHPARGECVGLNIVEAALFGLPIITTKYSAPARYLGEDYPIWLENYRLLKPGLDDGRLAEEVAGVTRQAMASFYNEHFPEDLRWAVVDTYELQMKMRQAYNMSREERQKRGKAGAEDMRWKFDWNSGIIQKRAERLKHCLSS